MICVPLNIICLIKIGSIDLLHQTGLCFAESVLEPDIIVDVGVDQVQVLDTANIQTLLPLRVVRDALLRRRGVAKELGVSHIEL